MKVCVLQTVLDPYKGGNHLPLFQSLGDVSFTIICNRSKVPKEELPPNVEVVVVPGRIGPYYYGSSDFRFAQLLLKTYPVGSMFWKQFDVIHANQVMGPALRTLRKTGVPLVFLIHHPVTADLEVAVMESGLIHGLLWRLKYYLLVSWQKKMCSSADMVITVSQTMKNRIAADYHFCDENIHVVPNGIDTDVFAPLMNEQCTVDVIAVGSFVHPRKGFPYLVEVYKQLAQRGISIADVGRRTEEQCRALRAITGVTTYGTVDSEKLIQLMRQARVLISTSLFEGFGLSLIEALSCGHPAYAFDVGAVPEVLDPIDPQLVSPVKNTDLMVQKVESFLRLSAEERDKKSKEYRRRVCDLWNIEKASKALKLAYKHASKA